MRGRRRQTAIALAIIGFLVGTGLGLWFGWEVMPVEYTDTDLSHLLPTYRDEYILMISKAYTLDGDLATARARFALLSLPDPADAVVARAEQAIAQNAPLSDIRALVRLATAIGAQHSDFAPYLPSEKETP